MDLKTACYCTACKQGTFQALQDLIAHVYYGEQERYTGIYYTIEQFSYKQLTNAAFSHVLGLLMEFHSEQDTAEVMKAIEQGAALTNVLEIAFLEIAPAIIDLFVAVFLFRVKFNSLAALCVLIATPSFLALEVSASSWNVYNRRQLTKVERGEARVMHQAIQDGPCRDVYSTGLMEACFPAAFVVLACLVANEIRKGRASPGDFVFLIQYGAYLIWPIKYLSKYYRWLVADLIDAERLLDLLTTKPTVTDKPRAFDLGPVQGYVEFENVFFSYNNGEPALCGINISAAPGDTIALVGTTGAGKSSLVKLLLRYYDVTSGCIKIDGQDIRDATQCSLRDALGIVSQNPILFSAPSMEDLRYAKLDSPDEEIYRVCRAAAIHDRSFSFPKGYQTQDGEQGVKLSRGEVQRLAIARAFLKDPSILVLDEATSAVDTEAEAKIQEALKGLIKDRTTFVIAHRLSAVVKADRILC
ncbi:heavy metal tolerance protein [Aspergillus lentulus]|uniref:Heavy metal tolerance protein n=1 Tax=Aspergillus lentulus TaxID=293939 RepID=A0AAN4PGK3_ASPLE|nr:heavy metal tolerance protein [Aspergillus lentulus]GFF70193.1 heavy metal tolerance protein [Aspergillus lentulus]